MIIPIKKLTTGHSIPCLGLGTWQLTGTDCVRTVKTALDLGYRHIDTAEMYGNHREVGRAIQESSVEREALFITSKLWRTNLGRDDVIASASQALQELGVDYLDLLLIHWPNKEVPMEETFGALKELYDSGTVRNIGVSNFTVGHLQEALKVAEIPIVVNQVEFHARLYQKDLKSFCDKHGIQLVAYSPLGHGKLLEDESLGAVAEKHDASIPQVELAWLLQKGLCTIPKASSEDHLRDNLGALEITLDEEDIERIDALDRHERYVEPGFAEFGKAKT